MAKVLGAADQEKCSEASATRRWVAGAKCDEDENTNHCEPRPLSAGVPTCQCLEPSSSRRWVAGAKCDDEQTKQHEGRPSDRHECAAGTDEAPCSRAPPQCSDAFESSACELELRGKGEPPKLRSRTPVAFNDKGEVLIARYVEDGRARTLVTEADSTTIIGKSTVESLVASTDDEVVTFMKALSNLGMFGLCYELGQTLIEISKILQTAREQRVFDIESAHYAFFGLEPDCDDRALDNSYRQMAKVMHPDKNGGTEEAKDLFQEMKQRYEALKEARSKTEGTPKDDKKESSEEQADDCCIQYDPSDRASMDTTVLKMLSQLRVMRCEESLIL